MTTGLESDTKSPYGTYRLEGLDRTLYRIAQGLGRGWVRFKLGPAFRKVVLRHKEMVDADAFGIRCRYRFQKRTHAHNSIYTR